MEFYGRNGVTTLQGIPKDFRWSFSKLNQFSTCPYSFKLTYLDKVKQIENAYSEYGTYCHTLLERYANRELQDYELADAYDKGYHKAVTLPFPPYPKGFAEKAYQQGLEYFMGFKGFGAEYEIISVEDKFETKIGGYVFSGIADLVLKNKKTNKYTVIDHKTKSTASMKKGFDELKRQLYVYARYVFERFGEFPDILSFNMIKTGEMLTIPFIMSEYEETMEWIVSTIESAILEFDWPVCTSPFFCSFICGTRYHCPAYQATTSYKKK